MKTYHLKWASHLPNMGEVFNTLYESDGLTDVTISCEDGKVRAHKLILSTCSDYFLDLFLENVGKQTFVVLPEVKVAELKQIVSFIYTGQINVTDETLTGLLSAADTLGVRGLKRPPAEEGQHVDDEMGAEEMEESGNDNDETTATEDNIKPSFQVKSEPPTLHIKSESELGVTPTTIQSKSQLPPVAEEQKLEIATTPLPPVNHVISSQANTESVHNVQQVVQNGVQQSVQNLQTQFNQHMFNFQNPYVPSGLLPGALATQQTNQLSANMTSPFPGNIATTMSSVSNGNGGLLTGSLATSIASLPGNLANLEAMYQSVQQQSPVKILPKLSMSDEDSSPIKPAAGTEGSKIQLELDHEAIRKIMENASTPICPMCNKDCLNLPNLRSHLQVHNNLKPFACKFCDAKFARVSHLNRHIRVHTGEKPFSCNLCQKSFARQDKLKVHMNRHNKDGGITMEVTVGKKRKKSKSTDSEGVLENTVGSGAAANWLSHAAAAVNTDNNQILPATMTHNNVNTPHNGNQFMNNGGTAGGGGNTGVLWNGFPPTITSMYEQYEPVYPGMMQYNNSTAGAAGMMKIGECSIKPLGQS